MLILDLLVLKLILLLSRNTRAIDKWRRTALGVGEEFLLSARNSVFQLWDKNA